jgi:hypothetical protein
MSGTVVTPAGLLARMNKADGRVCGSLLLSL